MDELKAEFKEYKQKVAIKLDKIVDDLDTYKDHLRTLDTNIQNHVIGCGLDAYKAEMRERCERLNDNWQTNKTMISDHKHENELQFTRIEEEFDVKITSQRTLSGKIISTGIVLGLCLVSVFAGIGVNKVSQTEFKQHIAVVADNMNKREVMMDRFIENYTNDRIRRDEKLDNVLHKQLDFNQSIMQNTSLLQQQLEVIKTKIKFKE
jgi:hypothetical protein